MTARPLRYAMVGGGPDAFIGQVHRTAARMDGHWRLVAGAFSSDPGKSAEQGRSLGLDPERVYGSWAGMLEAEAARRDGADAVVIVTPNHLHHPVAKAALEAGFHVICDKPLTLTVEEAEELCQLSGERDRVFCVTYNYTGYPLVKEARARVRSGALGDIRKVIVEYSQGWLSTLLEAEGHKQAEWRADPERAGVAAALGDIGVHAHNLMEYVTGLRVDGLLADLGTVVEGRRLEDDANLLLRLGDGGAGEGGAAAGDGAASGHPPATGIRGVMMVSQIAWGERNHLRLRVYGSEGSLDWCQERPNDLRIVDADGVERILHRGGEGLVAPVPEALRLPPGHPEGFLEAFANVYAGAARAIRAHGSTGASGEGRGQGAGSPDRDVAPTTPRLDFPSVQDGARGIHFVHAAVRSSREGGWVDARYEPPGAPDR